LGHGVDRPAARYVAMSRPWSVFRRFHRDARLFLVTTFVAGAALSLYWIDFNLYLASLGLSTAMIGIISTVAAVAAALVAFPARRHRTGSGAEPSWQRGSPSAWWDSSGSW
jgi:hypothetical protein